MTERSHRAMHNLFCVSANNMETALNTEQTLDTTMRCGLGDILQLTPRRQSNADEQTGKEEPSLIYEMGYLAEMSFAPPRCGPQHFGFILAYALGAIATTADGAGYQHIITPISGDLDSVRSIPSFTAAQKLGNTIVKRRMAGMFVDSFAATFAVDDWIKIAAQLKGTGKYADTITEETIAVIPAADPFPMSTSLTLAANGVEGATAAARLANVHQIRCEISSGEWTEVEFTAVSDATPAVITVEEINAESTDPVDWKVLYVPTEPAWATFPAVVTECDPLHISNIDMTIGGAWDGTTFQGGRSLAAELKNLVWNFSNNLNVQFVPGAGGNFAGRGFRNNRTQTIRLDREMREFCLQRYMENNETFGLKILAESEETYDTAKYFTVEVIFPKLGLLTAPVSVDGQVLAEAGDLIVMEDDTYGSVRCRVKNEVATYAA